MFAKLNPKVTKFLEDHPDITMASFAWSGYWRLTLYAWTIMLIMMLVAFIAGEIIRN